MQAEVNIHIMCVIPQGGGNKGRHRWGHGDLGVGAGVNPIVCLQANVDTHIPGMCVFGGGGRAVGGGATQPCVMARRAPGAGGASPGGGNGEQSCVPAGRG